MTSLLVLTDFSDSARNAALYALELAGSLPECDVVLLHVYPPAQTTASDGADEATIRKEAILKLANLEEYLRPYVGKKTILGCQVKAGSLLAALEEVVSREKVSLVIAGSKERTRMNEFLFGSTTKTLIDACIYPLLVVPASVRFKGIQSAVLACELKDVDRLPTLRIRSLVNDLGSELYVLNVDRQPREKLDADKIIQQQRLHRALEPLNPQYHYIRGLDVAHEINRFVRFTQADLLIVVHKVHGPVYKMLHPGTSNALAVHGFTPTLVLQEDGEDVTPYYSYAGRFDEEL